MDIIKKIIITGGAGYIGCHVVEELLKSNYQVVVIDKFSFDSHSLKSFQQNKNLIKISQDQISDYLKKIK